jgi:hypothetical protein
VTSDTASTHVAIVRPDTAAVERCTTPCEFAVPPGVLPVSVVDDSDSAFDRDHAHVVTIPNRRTSLRVRHPSGAPHIVAGFLIVQSVLSIPFGLLAIPLGMYEHDQTSSTAFGTGAIVAGVASLLGALSGFVVCGCLFGLDTSPRVESVDDPGTAARLLSSMHVAVAPAPSGGVLIVSGRF